MKTLFRFVPLVCNTFGTQILLFFGLSIMGKKFGPEFMGYQSLIFSIVSYLLVFVQLGCQNQGLKLLIEGYSYKRLWLQHTIIRFVLYSLILLTLFYLL